MDGAQDSYFVKHPGDLIGPGSALGNQTLN